MSVLLQDIKYGLRGFLNRPGFTLIVVITLALGIGANTAIFSVLNAVLFKPLPYSEPDRLVLIWERIDATGFLKASMPGPDIADFREQVPSLEAVAAMNNTPTATITGDGEPEEINLSGVTANFFAVLGVNAAIGRAFLPEDGLPFPAGSFNNPTNLPSSSIVLSYGFWQRRYAGDPDVIGRTVTVNGAPFEIVGVMPPGFRLHMPVDAGMSTDIQAWTPLRFDLRTAPRNNAFLRAVARMAPAANIERVRADLAAVGARLRSEYEYHGEGNVYVDAYPMHADVVGHVQPVLIALLGAVGFVLLIACGNVANLLLVRATSREREIAVRAALGSGRRRIMRQMLTESVMLAALGGLVGVFLAGWGIDLLVALKPDNLPRLADIQIDPRVLAYTAGASLLAALLFGILPAVQASRPDLTEALKERTGALVNVGRRRIRHTLVVVEVALSLVLLFGAGLLLQSFTELQRADLGFDPANVQTFSLSLPFVSYPQPDQRMNFFRALDERLSALPGVAAAGIVFPLPLGGRFWTGPYATVDSDPNAPTVEANYRVITPGYFAAMGTPLLSGRFFKDSDNEANRPVAIVDQSFAARVWPGDSPLGKQVEVDILLTGQKQWVEVVGVVANIRHDDLTADGRETIYFPHRLQLAFPGMSVVVRSSANPEALVNLIRREVAELDAGVPVSTVRTMGDYVSQAQAPTRFTLIITVVFAAVALVMASIGLYGVISSTVKQRTAELGIRMAFGAPGGAIVRSVVGGGILLSGIGVLLGIVGSLALGRVFSSVVVGVNAADPGTLIVVGVVLIAVSGLASFIPARRATRIDPVIALRNH